VAVFLILHKTREDAGFSIPNTRKSKGRSATRMKLKNSFSCDFISDITGGIANAAQHH